MARTRRASRRVPRIEPRSRLIGNRERCQRCDSASGARLDPGQVRDVRGRTASVRMGGRALGAGGGILGLIIAVVVLLLNGGGGGGTTSPRRGSGANRRRRICSAGVQTGEDANQLQDCRIVGVVNSVQDYWSDTVAGYHEAPTTFFTRPSETGCGIASSAVGPFYCPADESVYVDLGFFDDLAVTVRCARWAVRGGVCHRARVRPSRPEPARYDGAGAETARPARRARRFDWSYRPTATRVCGRTNAVDNRLHRAAHRRRHRERSRRRRGRRRRPHPGARRRPRRSRSVDARVGGAAASVVQHRLRHRRSEPVRHVRHRGVCDA